MARSVKEWIGKTDDAKIPPRVRLRVWDRHNGICHISKRKIMPGEPWDCDHIVALINGGEHREYNLAPALRDKHREKTKDDVRQKSDVAEIRKKHHSIKGEGPPMPGSRRSPWKRRLSSRGSFTEKRT